MKVRKFCTAPSIFYWKNLAGKKTWTHIIVDEVYERNKEFDLLLVAIKKSMHLNVRVIIMAATIDAEQVRETIWIL